jgi:hypothetical protein
VVLFLGVHGVLGMGTGEFQNLQTCLTFRKITNNMFNFSFYMYNPKVFLMHS